MRIASVMAVSGWTAAAQLATDTMLFEIKLNDDSASLLCCKWGGGIRRTLSGPVVMEDEQLLFYSENGYILYDQHGAVVDSHSVFDENRKLAPDDPSRLRLAQPIDNTTLAYFRKSGDEKERPVTIYLKRISRRRLKPLKDEEYDNLGKIGEAQVFNIAHNSITDEMRARAYLEPQLVGYAIEKQAGRWWTLDRFYSFSSPLIHEDEGSYQSFFPGMKSSMDASREVKREMVEPLATFVRDGRRHYVGIYASLGTSKDQYFQHLYVCDAAGNILYTDTLLKQANTDVVLGEDVQEKMYYTAKQTARYVFQPAVSSDGTVYYGTIDYEAKNIEVRKRTFLVYRNRPAGPDLAHLIDL
ncbi:MAG: hypothetical protein GF410_05585, partial [Chitinivibrionales bacterium]|nr:hypothetical protein [Chitinivibrionales bacterium]